MTIEEIKWLIEVIGKYSIGGLVAGGVLFLLTKNYLSSYLHEKGANLAKKEDITELTGLVKDVEHKYNVLIHEMNVKQQLRMAAVDKRLQAHQDAFAMWRKLTGTEKHEEDAAVLECQTWWEKNCLYLHPEVREAFVVAYTGFKIRRELLNSGAEAFYITAAWKDVTAFPHVLFNAVQLPALSPAEEKAVIPTVESNRSRSTV